MGLKDDLAKVGLLETSVDIDETDGKAQPLKKLSDYVGRIIIITQKKATLAEINGKKDIPDYLLDIVVDGERIIDVHCANVVAYNQIARLELGSGRTVKAKVTKSPEGRHAIMLTSAK